MWDAFIPIVSYTGFMIDSKRREYLLGKKLAEHDSILSKAKAIISSLDFSKPRYVYEDEKDDPNVRA